MKLTDDIHEKLESRKEKIGELLIQHTSLTKIQLSEALEIQKESGSLIGEILLRKNYIHPHDIIKVICHQIEIPYKDDINMDEIDAELINHIPINYAKNHEVLPILETDLSVTVVATDPSTLMLSMIFKSFLKKKLFL